jgi:hypothetical protein
MCLPISKDPVGGRAAKRLESGGESIGNHDAVSHVVSYPEASRQFAHRRGEGGRTVGKMIRGRF